MYLGVVVNPFARKNRGMAGNRSAALRRIVGPWGEVHETGSVGELPGIVERLFPRASHLVSDGGDGALHSLINEMRAQVSDPQRWPVFVPTNGGAIDFVARKARVRGPADAVLHSLITAARADRLPPQMQLDTLELLGETVDGTTFHRVGFALAAGGVGNRFFDKYYQHHDPGRVTIARVIACAVGEYAASRAVPRRANRPLCGPAVRPDARSRRHRRQGGHNPSPQCAARGRVRRESWWDASALPAGTRTRCAAFSGRGDLAFDDHCAPSGTDRRRCDPR